MGKTRQEYYEILRSLIVKDEVLLFPHKRFRGARRSYVYARCGMSQKYFEKAYQNREVILQFGHIGPRVGAPVDWQEALQDHLSEKPGS